MRIKMLPIAAAAILFAGTASAQDMVVKIGHVGPTSGAIAHLGKDNENGARMAIEALNAKGVMIGGKKAKFELLAEDDGGDPKQGTSAAQKLVDSKVNGVIGHLNSGTSIPASKIYSDAGIPQISPSATNPKFTRNGYKTTFRVVADDVHLGGTLGKYAVTQLKGKSIAVIDDRTAYGQGVADEFEKGVKGAGGKTVAREFTNDKATDFTAILTSIKAKNPDVVFFGGMDAVAGPMMRQMKQLGISAKFVGGDGICSSELPKLAAGHHGRRPSGLRRGGWCRRRGQEVDGRFLRCVQEEVQRRRESLCAVCLRRAERHGGCDGQSRLGRTRQVPAGAGCHRRLQGRDGHHRLRQQGRHQERCPDAVHLQG